MSNRLDADWLRKSFKIGEGSVVFPESDNPWRKVPLYKVLKAVPLSSLGTTLQSLTLNQKQWKKLAASDSLKDVARKWRELVEPCNILVDLGDKSLKPLELAKAFETFEDFKNSVHFGMLTSEISTVEIFDIHNYTGKADLKTLFSNIDNAPISKGLKRKLLKLAADHEERGYNAYQIFLIVFFYLQLAVAYGYNAAQVLDTLTGMVCRIYPAPVAGWSVYTTACRIQKGLDSISEGVWAIKGDNVNLRNAPSAKALSLMKLGAGQTFLLLDDAGNGWYKIAIDVQGVRHDGWIYKRFAMLLKPPTF